MSLLEGEVTISSNLDFYKEYVGDVEKFGSIIPPYSLKIPKFEDINIGDIFKIYENTLVYSSLIDELCSFPETKYIKVIGKSDRIIGDLILFNIIDMETNTVRLGSGVFDVNWIFLNLPT